METPPPWLSVWCNIVPPKIRRKEALLKDLNKITSAFDAHLARSPVGTMSFVVELPCEFGGTP